MTVFTQFRDKNTGEPVEAPKTSNPNVEPWKSYDREMSTEIRDPKLAAEVKEYESRPKHERPDSLTAEELAEIREQNMAMVSQFRFDHQEELLDEKTRMGQTMQDTEFLARLAKIGVEGCFVPGVFRTKSRVSLSGYKEYVVVGLKCWVPTENGGGWKFVCQIQPGIMPEYSVLRVDDHYVPLGEKYRGWRTVGLRLIMAGIVTEEQFHKEFGEATGPASRRYRETLFGWRNRPRVE
jgi:hypothetical protein